MFRIRSAVWLALLGFTSAAADREAPTWPQFRGPGGAGVAAESDDPPVDFGPGKRMLWRTPTPSGHSSPSVWGERIFLTAYDKPAGRLEVLSLDRKSGKLLWRRTIPAERIETVHEVSNPATATPAVDGERVYAYFGSYGLVCFDFEGNQQWSVPLPVVNVPYGSGTSPILAGGLVIVSRDEGKEPHLLAVDSRTGKTAWKQKQYQGAVEGRAFNESTPALWKDEVIVHHRNEIVGFDLKTGGRKWWVRASSQGTGTPVAGPDAIYVGTWFNNGEPDLRVPLPDFNFMLRKHDKNNDELLSADEFPETIVFTRRMEMIGITGSEQSAPGKSIFEFTDKNKDGRLDRSEWDSLVKAFSGQPAPEHGLLAIRPGGEGDVTSTRVLWKETRGVPEVPTPLFYRGRVYAVTNGGIVSVMEAQTGRLAFRGRLGAGGPYYASPVAARGRIYFASGEGILTVIRDGDKLEVLSRNDFQEPLFATPAITEGVIYVRTPAYIYAFRNSN